MRLGAIISRMTPVIPSVRMSTASPSAVWHVVEFKIHSAKSFAELVAKGVVLAKSQHAAQMQIYIHLAGIIRALYLAVC